MIKLDELFCTEEMFKVANLLLQIHDELVFEVPESKLHQIAPRLKEIMEGVVKLDVPLPVTV
jgi:DNA polymerase-1